MPVTDAGRMLLLLGGVIFLMGLLFTLAGSLPFVGRLPGDLSFDWGGARLYVPLATMILLSVVLTVVTNILTGAFRR
jgi:hypothetical protein